MKDEKKLLNNIISACQEKKAKNIVTVDMTKLPGSICQHFVICNGTTPTQVSAIADEVIKQAREMLNDRPINTDGMREARWIGIDYGTVIVHIFIPELRDFYDIEHLWADADVEYIPDMN